MPHTFPSSASDFVNDIHPQEQEQLARELREGETLRWAARPQGNFWEFGSASDLFCGLIASLVLGWMTARIVAEFCDLLWLPLGMVLPFWCLVLWHTSAPWRRLWRLRRTLYIITNRRALVTEPGVLMQWRVQSWPLREHMVLQRRAYGAGHGQLVFSHETVYPMFGRAYADERGFLCLADLSRAENELQQAIANIPR